MTSSFPSPDTSTPKSSRTNQLQLAICANQLSNVQMKPEEEQSLSLAERLRKHNEEQKAAFLQRCKEKEEGRRNASLEAEPLTRLNYEDVPEEIKQHVRALPIYARRAELVEMVKNHQIVIVMGETGSGKSTQIPQFLLEAGFCDNDKGIIGITQPRRVAAKSLAKRVAKEGAVEMGTLVGYSVRFDKCFSGETLIKYMTDGMLLSECVKDHNLTKYSVIMIDEAHDRSVNMDVCLGWIKKLAKRRPELKVIISSATLNEERFSSYFGNAPVFQVPGRMHPVEVLYSPCPIENFKNAVVKGILEIHAGSEEGDVLVFLPGQVEIEEVMRALEFEETTSMNRKLLVLPCYGAMLFNEQQKIFEPTPPKHRKVVLATNIAETSITIENIVFVIDSGFRKVMEYNPFTKIDTLRPKPITKFQAIQRMGRAGRTKSGKCYRLYTQLQYEAMESSPAPEILASNLESVMLQLVAMGVTNPFEFDYMDFPPGPAMMMALGNLWALEAMDSSYTLTPLGAQMATFPLDPSLARVLIESSKLDCSAEVIKICAMLSSSQSKNLFFNGRKIREKVDKKRVAFNQPEGDFLTLLKVYDCWKDSGFDETWCKKNYIEHRTLDEAEDIRLQLTEIYESHGYTVSRPESLTPDVKRNIGKAFTAGYFRQVARRHGTTFAYHILTDTGLQKEVYIHPSSALFHKRPYPEWLIYHEVTVTTKAFMREVIAIEPEWIRLYSPMYADRLKTYYRIEL